MAIKVLMFGWEFPPHNSGGLGVACFGLTKALTESNVDITFVLPRRIQVNSTTARILFADIERINVNEIDSLLTPYITSDMYGNVYEGAHHGIYESTLMGEVKRYAKRAREIARTESFDVIHAHDWLSFLAGLEAKRVSGKPLIVHVHATEFDRTGGTGVNQDVYDIERRGMHEADGIIAVSNWTKNILVERYDVFPEKISVVHNGVEEEEFSSESAPKLENLKRAGYGVVLFVGRITLQKGPDYFVLLAKRILEFRPKTIFVVSGSGDMEGQMIREVAEAGISDKVLFAGFLRGEDLRAMYRSADLYVMTSVSEPFGITPLEALSSGTPVLVSKQSGVAEVLSHVFKADFWDIDDMADKAISLLDHPQLKETMRANGRTEVKRSTWMLAAQKCVGVYNKVISLFKDKT